MYDNNISSAPVPAFVVNLLILEKGHNCTTIRNCSSRRNYKTKIPQNSSQGEMARNIARAELKATISL